jgi:hypothetical protein
MVGGMAFKVFLTYSTNPDEQVIVWRLQTLAAASGIYVYVPFRTPSQSPILHGFAALSNEVTRAIEESDCVLALITTGTGPQVDSELNYALMQGRLVIPIVEEAVTLNPEIAFGRVFQFSRHQLPGEIESQVVEFLKQQKVSKENQELVGGLVSVGLGMLLLAAFTKK